MIEPELPELRFDLDFEPIVIVIEPMPEIVIEPLELHIEPLPLVEIEPLEIGPLEPLPWPEIGPFLDVEMPAVPAELLRPASE